jgi:hypothetical protein
MAMTLREKLKSKPWWKRVFATWLMFVILSVLFKALVFRRDDPLDRIVISSVITGLIFSMVLNLFFLKEKKVE